MHNIATRNLAETFLFSFCDEILCVTPRVVLIFRRFSDVLSESEPEG
jgi:hypothetical protein